MAIDVTKPRTRRAVIVGAIGGSAALAASSFGRPLEARAADGDAVQVGKTYSASTVTAFDAGGTAATALEGDSGSGIGVVGSADDGIGVKGICPGGIGVWAESVNSPAVHAVSGSGDAVEGVATDGAGVSGASTNGTGVAGTSTTGTGVGGFSWSPGMPGIEGRSVGNNTGVFGYSGSQPWTPTTPAKTGVYGYAAQDVAAVAVRGDSTSGRGVQGAASSGIGVRAAATTGHGVYATASTGTAVYAASGGLKTGTALRTVGRVRFDSCVGIALIAAGTASVVVTPGIDLQKTSAVVATLQANPAGTLAVKGVVVNPANDTFTIYLTSTATTGLPVAWHVFG